MESRSITQGTHSGVLAGKSPLLRLQSDDRLIASIRHDNIAAFEVLFERYRPRLLAFCRHMLRSNEDAEDVLQEVFTNAYNAIRADDRKIQARPWLYRIARNRCLNHLRKPVADGQDSMDIIQDLKGTTDETVQKRATFINLVSDVGRLPEAQRSALLLREIDCLSYDQIAEAMETTVPSVKSLLVRARVSLAEAAEAREITCDEVRLELGEVAEGLKKPSPPVRRHLRMCSQCKSFKAKLKENNTALHSIFVVGLLPVLKGLSLAKVVSLFTGGGSTAGGAAAGGGALAGSGAGAAAVGGAAAGGAASGASIGIGAVGAKIAAGVAVTAVTAVGAVEIQRNIDATPVSEPKVAHVSKPKVTPAPAAAAEPTKTELTLEEETVPAPPATTVEETTTVAEPTVTTPAEESQEKEPKLAEEEGETNLEPPPAESVPAEMPVEETPPAEPAPEGTGTEDQGQPQTESVPQTEPEPQP